MASLDGIANARTAITDAEGATRERIHNPSKVCTRCGDPYEYSFWIGPDFCEHDGVPKQTNTPYS
jgi:hypothetical protein